MYKMTYKVTGEPQFELDKKVYETRKDAENEYQIQLAKIQIAALQMEEREKAEFRKKFPSEKSGVQEYWPYCYERPGC